MEKLEYQENTGKLYITTESGLIWEYNNVTKDMYEFIFNKSNIFDGIRKLGLVGVRRGTNE